MTCVVLYHKCPAGIGFDVLVSSEFKKRHPRLVKIIKETAEYVAEKCMYVKKFKRLFKEYKEYEIIASCDFASAAYAWDSMYIIKTIMNNLKSNEIEIKYANKLEVIC